MDIFVLVITIWGNNGTDWVYVGNQYVMKEQFTLEQCQMIARDSNWREFKTKHMPLGRINIKSQSSRANESPTNANYRGVGLSEMISCIQQKKKHKCNGDLSLHVLNIIEAIHLSAKKGVSQKISMSCERPRPFTTKDINSILK